MNESQFVKQGCQPRRQAGMGGNNQGVFFLWHHRFSPMAARWISARFLSASGACFFAGSVSELP
jgi:hypothetical protein